MQHKGMLHVVVTAQDVLQNYPDALWRKLEKVSNSGFAHFFFHLCFYLPYYLKFTHRCHTCAHTHIDLQAYTHLGERIRLAPTDTLAAMEGTQNL